MSTNTWKNVHQRCALLSNCWCGAADGGLGFCFQSIRAGGEVRKCRASRLAGEGINLYVFLESNLAIAFRGLKIPVTLLASSNSTLGKF